MIRAKRKQDAKRDTPIAARKESQNGEIARWNIPLWIVLSVGAALLVGSMMLYAWQGAPTRQFATAQAHWLTEPIPHYRLVIQRAALHCKQVIIVRHEEIMRVVEDTCPIQPMTVTGLFHRIETLDGQRTIELFLEDGCPCISELTARVRYDPGGSYPTHVTLLVDRKADWHEPACWRSLLFQGKAPKCSLPGVLGMPRVTQISLTPLADETVELLK